MCLLQDWVKERNLKVIVLFEGRDAAGKGGTIKAVTEKVSPRVFPRRVALPAPSDREKSQMFVQRYMQHFPAGGEIVIFDRSWYNRAGVEYVMGFCWPDEHRRFLSLCPQIEKYIVDAGIILIKLWLEVGMEEQERRFKARIDDPLRQWKLSPMDSKSYRRWYDYSRARDQVHAQGHEFKTRTLVCHSLGRQATSPAKLYRAFAEDDPLQEGFARSGAVAKTIRQGPLQ